MDKLWISCVIITIIGIQNNPVALAEVGSKVTALFSHALEPEIWDGDDFLIFIFVFYFIFIFFANFLFACEFGFSSHYLPLCFQCSNILMFLVIFHSKQKKIISEVPWEYIPNYSITIHNNSFTFPYSTISTFFIS